MTLNPRPWRALFAALALVAIFALAHQVGTAVSEQRAFDPEPPCPKSVEEAFRSLSDTMHALAHDPHCDRLYERFERAGNLGAAQWTASQARNEGCW